LKVEGLSTAKGSKARLNLQTSVNKRGHVGVVGTLGLAPLAGSLDLDLKTVDLAMLQPYVTEKVKIAITRGNVTSRGRLAFELPAAGGGVKGGFKGALTVGNFASVDKLNATDFLKWKSLYFGGMDIRLSPLAVSIDEIALSDFYTRLILDAQGGLNIREITAQQATENKEAREAATPAQPLPPILIKRITLQGGNIAYSDRFIRPNYDANLTGMGGHLTGFVRPWRTIAELDLRGKVDNARRCRWSAGSTPSARTHLDILASVKDFELSGRVDLRGQVRGLRHREGQAVGRPQLQGHRPQAHRHQPHLPRPADLRRRRWTARAPSSCRCSWRCRCSRTAAARSTSTCR
jgi:hypothetical protein